MSNERPLPILRGFLTSLAFVLEDEDGCFWARRLVAGEELKLCFCPARGEHTQQVREAIKALNKAGRTELGVNTYLVGIGSVQKDLEHWARDLGIAVTTELGYLNLAIQSERTCTETVAEANRYIPEEEYVEPRIAPEDQPASQYLSNWISSPEAALLLVLGHAGYGKTCLSYQVGRRLAREHMRSPDLPVPFVLALHRHRHVRRFEELVLTHLQDRGILGFTSKAFAFLANHERLIPILDGFDELAETGGLRVARETLRGLIEQLGEHAKVIVTSRQAYFRHKGDLSLVGDLNGLLSRLQTREIQPFNETERKSFLAKRDLSSKHVAEVENAVRGLAAEEFLKTSVQIA